MIRKRIDLMDNAAVRQFVDRSDELGGPDAVGAQAWWKQVDCIVPPWLQATMANFDPLSPSYFELQEQLYSSISGRPAVDAECELTPFDQDQAVRALTAYPNRMPKNINRYFHVMAKLADQFDTEGPCEHWSWGAVGDSSAGTWPGLGIASSPWTSIPTLSRSPRAAAPRPFWGSTIARGPSNSLRSAQRNAST